MEHRPWPEDLGIRCWTVLNCNGSVGGLGQTFNMASIPAGALILTQEEALSYFHQWSAGDRAVAREWIERTEVTEFYVPPSGSYVAGHGGPNYSAYRDMPVNGLVMHVGFLHAWPNEAEVDGDERIELSNSRGASSRSAGTRSARVESSPRICPRCHLDTFGAVDECENCGHDFAQARAESIARFREAQARARARLAERGHG